MECKSCGTSNPDDAPFCSKCGFNLHLSSPSPTPEPMAPPALTGVSVSTVLVESLSLITGPAQVMAKKKDAVFSMKTVAVNYVAVLAIIPFVATVAGDVLFYGGGASILVFAIAYGLDLYIFDIAAVLMMGFVIWKLAPYFGTPTDEPRATLLALYVGAPFFLVSVIDVIPIATEVSYLALLYGVYILYRGLPIMLGTRPGRVPILVAVIFGASIAVLVLVVALQYSVAVTLASLLSP